LTEFRLSETTQRRAWEDSTSLAAMTAGSNRYLLKRRREFQVLHLLTAESRFSGGDSQLAPGLAILGRLKSHRAMDQA